MNRALVMLLTVASTTAAQTNFPSQSHSLLPQKTEGVVIFQCYAPEAHVVYLDLREEENLVLVKISRGIGPNGLYFRVAAGSS